MRRTQQLNGHSKRPQWFGDPKHGAGALAINDAGDSGDPFVDAIADQKRTGGAVCLVGNRQVTCDVPLGELRCQC